MLSCPFHAEHPLHHSQKQDRTAADEYERQQSEEELPAVLSTSSSTSSSGNATDKLSLPGAIPSWLKRRPMGVGQPHLGRRELRKLDRQWRMSEVAKHKYVDDIWIVVDGRVYDISEHLIQHYGWSTAAISTPLSILASGGTDCSQEFHELHRPYPVAYKQLQAYYIGDLDQTAE